MYKITYLILTLLLLPVLAQGAEITHPISSSIKNPMRPPAFALQKYQQAKNKSKPKVVVVQRNLIKSKTLQLTSILYSPTRKIAIIDEKMLSVGDSINGARLVSIEKDNARLIKNGKSINLRLSNQSKIIRKTVVQKSAIQDTSIQRMMGEKKL